MSIQIKKVERGKCANDGLPFILKVRSSISEPSKRMKAFPKLSGALRRNRLQ